MKVINLDQFSSVQLVEFDGKQYTIRGIDVNMYLNDKKLKSLETTTKSEDKVKLTIDLLAELSDIPKEVLLKQSMPMLTALMQVASGTDPNEEEGEKRPNV